MLTQTLYWQCNRGLHAELKVDLVDLGGNNNTVHLTVEPANREKKRHFRTKFSCMGFWITK